MVLNLVLSLGEELNNSIFLFHVGRVLRIFPSERGAS